MSQVKQLNSHSRPRKCMFAWFDISVNFIADSNYTVFTNASVLNFALTKKPKFCFEISLIFSSNYRIFLANVSRFQLRAILCWQTLYSCVIAQFFVEKSCLLMKKLFYVSPQGVLKCVPEKLLKHYPFSKGSFRRIRALARSVKN